MFTMAFKSTLMKTHNKTTHMNKFKAGQRVRIKKVNPGHLFEVGTLATVLPIEDIEDDMEILTDDGQILVPDHNELEIIPSIRGVAEVYKSTHKSVPGFRYRLKGNNGEKVHPSEHYTQKKNALQTLSRLFPEFEVVDFTKAKSKKR